MVTLAILNPKGGCGKTTLATHLARAWIDAGRSVTLVDSDPQGSARDWHAIQEDNPVPMIALDRPSLLARPPRDDCVIIDGAAKMSDLIAAAIRVADAILIPVQPSPYDIWAVADMVGLIRARRSVTDGQPAVAFVLTRVIPRTRLSGDVLEALHEYEFKVLENVIQQRQIYPQTANDGLTVFDSVNKEAAGEVLRLANEVGTWLWP